MSFELTRKRATSSPDSVRELSTPAGRPATSDRISCSSPFTRPVWPGSFTTAVHPAASAGASERAASTTGEFQGTITPATPMASGTELMCRPGDTSAARPLSLRASAA